MQQLKRRRYYGYDVVIYIERLWVNLRSCVRELVEFGRVRRVVINNCVLNFECNKVASWIEPTSTLQYECTVHWKENMPPSGRGIQRTCQYRPPTVSCRMLFRVKQKKISKLRMSKETVSTPYKDCINFYCYILYSYWGIYSFWMLCCYATVIEYLEDSLKPLTTSCYNSKQHNTPPCRCWLNTKTVRGCNRHKSKKHNPHLAGIDSILKQRLSH
jgi:hypothetical protein